MVKTSSSKEGGVGLISSWGAKTPHGSRPEKQNIKQKHCNKFNKDFKKWSASRKKKKKFK